MLIMRMQSTSCPYISTGLLTFEAVTVLFFEQLPEGIKPGLISIIGGLKSWHFPVFRGLVHFSLADRIPLVCKNLWQ